MASQLQGCQLVVIDVLENPEVAEQEQILATPTLIRSEPLPRRQLVGDLTDLQRVREVLSLEVKP